MKSSFLRPALVLAMALGLASCGGKATFNVAGNVSGLYYEGLVLSTNGATVAVKPGVSGATVPFSFPNSLEYGETYDVKVAQDPLHQNCTVGNASDTAGRMAAINVSVVCFIDSHVLSGTITGLTGTGLRLGNGSDIAPIDIVAGLDKFVFPNVAYGITYGITVLKQPDGQTCTVTNGSGIMGDEDLLPVVDSARTAQTPPAIVVNCSDNPPAANPT
jgi:hypothetical protein